MGLDKDIPVDSHSYSQADLDIVAQVVALVGQD